MSVPLVYLFNRFFHRIIDFLRHWYWDSFYFVSRKTFNILERLDRTLAFKITLSHFFKPLYQDYTAVGYLLGVILRFFRASAAAVLYFLILAAAFSVYAVWALIPIMIIYRLWHQ